MGAPLLDLTPLSGGLPQVTIKIAQTIDGRIATSSGQSRWITGPASRAAGHQLRAEHDAILVGVGTILADDPQLNVRLAAGPSPLKVVLDSSLRTPVTARILADDPHRTLIFTAASTDRRLGEAVAATGAEVSAVPSGDRGLQLIPLLQALSERGIASVLVEGGASVTTSFLRQQLASRACIFIAPKILGQGIDSVGNLDSNEMRQAIQLGDVTWDVVGGDILVRASLVYPGFA